MGAREQQPPEERDDLAPDVQEIYVDSVQVSTSLYGSTLRLGTLREGQQPLVRVVIKVSPQMVKVLKLILSKHARDYEQRFGPIGIPNELLHHLGLEEEIQ